MGSCIHSVAANLDTREWENEDEQRIGLVSVENTGGTGVGYN